MNCFFKIPLARIVYVIYVLVVFLKINTVKPFYIRFERVLRKCTSIKPDVPKTFFYIRDILYIFKPFVFFMVENSSSGVVERYKHLL